MEIIPALMPKSRHELEEQLSRVRGLVQTVQIDVMDGKFVQNRSWPYYGGGGSSETGAPAYSDDFVSVLHEEDGLPFWEDLNFEADLMVADPAAAFEDWILAGASRIIIHAESFGKDEAAGGKLVSFINSVRERFSKGLSDTPVGLELGVAVMPGTSPETVPGFSEIARELDFVQCMGISKIGFQGQPFDERVLQTIRAFKKAYPELLVSVDGGVNFETAPLLKEAGAERLVSGSAIFDSGDIRGAIENFNTF